LSAVAAERARLARRRWVQRLVGRTTLYAIYLVVLFVALFPLLWVVGLSLKTREQALAWPPVLFWTPTLDNYVAILSTADFFSNFVNSVVASVCAVGLSLLIGLPTAFAVSRTRFRGRNTIYISLLLMRMAPPIAVLVPMFVLFRLLGISNSLLTIILAYTTFCLPLVVWIMRGFIDGIPKELEESALIDGASRFQVLTLVYLPLLRPGLTAAAILSLLLAWNDFLFAAVLTNSRTQTLPVMLARYSGGDTGTEWGLMTALATLVVLPVLIFSMFAQRHLVSGLSSGAVKG
jgi:multiple sugar transport system permease protein